MAPFICLREINSTDSIKIVKLKNKYNRCASLLNCHCENGIFLSGAKKCELLHELFLSGKEINEYEKKKTYWS
jgi:hypothetical protein